VSKLRLFKPVSMILIYSLCVFRTMAQESRLELLKRPAVLRNMKGTSAEAIASLLAQARVPGGIVSISANCDKPNDLLFASKSETLQGGLDYVSSLDASQAWIYKNGVVLAGRKQARKTLLKTTISEITIDPNETLSLATQRLLETAEVRGEVAKNGLEELTTPLGFSAIQPVSNRPSVSSENRKPELLQRKSLEDALNALALSRNSAVWHYEQFVCGKKTSFRVSWPVTGP